MCWGGRQGDPSFDKLARLAQGDPLFEKGVMFMGTCQVGSCSWQWEI